MIFSLHRQVRKELKQLADIPKSKQTRFYKVGEGDYAEKEQFLGVRVPQVRQLVKVYQYMTLQELEPLIQSPFNEERLFALLILVQQYPKNSEEIYRYYLEHTRNVNNWNLVDASAHLIVGKHLFNKDRSLLFTLAKSEDLWERRIAIVATWYFIRQGDLDWTFKLAETLLHDPHDLIQKAVGWMLREAGKKESKLLLQFLDRHFKNMPRTMLRYAIERLPAEKRVGYLSLSKKF